MASQPLSPSYNSGNPNANANAGGPSNLPPPPSAVEVVQPTVRVMRLYKPCMHLLSTTPLIPPTLDTDNKGAGIAISSYLLLPDSFGEIFMGETFSAYIAVVNGSDITSFNEVYLSVRLQTSNASYDLMDFRASDGQGSGYTKVLNPNGSLDLVVRHTLTELGTHTLRVSVQYLNSPLGGLNQSGAADPKTLRKFYRFSALQPLHIASSCSELQDQVMIQFQITNGIKTPLYIEKVIS